MKKPDPSLPPWPARNEADNERMLSWLDEKVTELHENEVHIEDNPDIMANCLELAEAGDIEPLRDTLVELTKKPELARFINLPKLPRGKHRKYPDDVWWDSKLNYALKDVFRIRDVWCKYYGKRRRRPADGWSAVEFAARMWRVDSEKLQNKFRKRR